MNNSYEYTNSIDITDMHNNQYSKYQVTLLLWTEKIWDLKSKGLRKVSQKLNEDHATFIRV